MHLAFVWRVLRSLGVPPSDIEDVCQEVFLVIHRKLGDFESVASLSSWIYGICWRVWRDHRDRAYLRYEGVMAPVPEANATPGTTPLTPDDWANNTEALAILSRILDRLDDNRRVVFVLCDLEQVPMKEVAEAIGCPLQTGYTRLHAARSFVRAEWRRLRGEERYG